MEPGHPSTPNRRPQPVPLASKPEPPSILKIPKTEQDEVEQQELQLFDIDAASDIPSTEEDARVKPKRIRKRKRCPVCGEFKVNVTRHLSAVHTREDRCAYDVTKRENSAMKYRQCPLCTKMVTRLDKHLTRHSTHALQKNSTAYVAAMSHK
ncbi:uncharacterized protein LOC141911030 [Tubulanus polymorphus]|uniref:uncharacterized protein LOC141911030 n=1 Tax=Tubulanus polymorphus TaxID=672921 RepID=UPI003DA6265A